MHVQSTLNASNKAEGLPVAVFRYRGKRKFLVKEKEYEDTIRLVKEGFGIAGDVAMYTSTLDVCRDQFVEIGPSAYSALRHVLDEIVVADAGSDPEEATVNRKLKARMSTATVSASSSTVSVARRLHGGQLSASSSARTVQAPRPSVVVHQQPQRTSAVHETVTRRDSAGSMDVKDYQSTSEAEDEKDPLVHDQGPHQEYQPDNPVFETEGEGEAEAYVPEREQEDEVEEAAEENQGDDVFGDADEELPAPESEVTHTEELDRRTSEEFDMVPERNHRAESPQFGHETHEEFHSPASAKRPPKSQAQLAAELFPESPSPPPRSKQRGQPLAEASDAPVKSERTPIVKPEPGSGRPTSSKRAPAAARSSKPNKSSDPVAPIDGNARIAILIQAPAEDNEDGPSATFKMRGRHMVHKILKTACETFGLDFQNASLFLAQDVFDDDGYVTGTDYVLCRREHTAAQCGITDGAKLVIQIEED